MINRIKAIAIKYENQLQIIQGDAEFDDVQFNELNPSPDQIDIYCLWMIQEFIKLIETEPDKAKEKLHFLQFALCFIQGVMWNQYGVTIDSMREDNRGLGDIENAMVNSADVAQALHHDGLHLVKIGATVSKFDTSRRCPTSQQSKDHALWMVRHAQEWVWESPAKALRWGGFIRAILWVHCGYPSLQLEDLFS